MPYPRQGSALNLLGHAEGIERPIYKADSRFDTICTKGFFMDKNGKVTVPSIIQALAVKSNLLPIGSWSAPLDIDQAIPFAFTAWLLAKSYITNDQHTVIVDAEKLEAYEAEFQKASAADPKTAKEKRAARERKKQLRNPSATVIED